MIDVKNSEAVPAFTTNGDTIITEGAPVPHAASATTAQSTRLYIKPHCPWCLLAMDWLRSQHIPYRAVDVIADPAAFAEMRRLSGQTLAPVIDVGGQVLADFGPSELAAFWKRLPR